MNQAPQEEGPHEYSYREEVGDVNDGESHLIDEEVQYLSQLLQETGVGRAEDLPVGIQAMLEVARKYPTAGVTDPLVADELISVLLRDHQAIQNLSSEQAAELHHSVSQALLEDPVASERLISLWNQVIERSQ